MSFYLFKLAGESDRARGLPWAIFEYTDGTYTVKKSESPLLALEIYCEVPCKTFVKDGGYYMAVFAELDKFDNRVFFR